MCTNLQYEKKCKTQPVKMPQYNHDLDQSMHETSHDDVQYTTMDETTIEDGEKNKIMHGFSVYLVFIRTYVKHKVVTLRTKRCRSINNNQYHTSILSTNKEIRH